MSDPQASIPDRHAAVLLRDGSVPIGLAATADARGWVVSKLSSENEAAWVWLAGSSFEADLMFASLARAHLPELYAQAMARLGVVWLAADPGSPGEGWRVLDTPDAGSGSSRVLGPFLDRTAARRWSEMLDDQFELCRFPGELRRAPRGTPCAYKEMGRCPAACDGSEPMERYRSRLDAACGLTVQGVRQRRAGAESAMRSAAAEARFEEAGALRDRAASIPDDAAAWVSLVDAPEGFGFVAVARSERTGWARVFRLSIGRWFWVCDTEARTITPERASALLAGMDNGWEVGEPDSGSADPVVTGLIARAWARPARGGPRLHRLADLTADTLTEAIRSAVPSRRRGRTSDASPSAGP